MRLRKATLAALVLTGAAVALAIVFGGGKETERATAAVEAAPGEPVVSIVSPRNGEVQANHAVVVKVDLENFELAPRHFGQEPEFGEGAIRFGLNRVPNCVDPVKLQRAINSPTGNERLTGKPMDFPKYAGPNGILAEELGTDGSFSPATRPEIFYHQLPPGFYRLTVTLAQNNLAVTPYHAVTNFQILPRPGQHIKEKCPPGYVTSAKAAEITH
ncbi:MAG TPA: hypothetical protein VHZ54_18830 [Solirubrobacterales bacterium]|jgi:hypothetical protein|nr:hypothetical protein [Solirubrobacterales bacterium]